MVIGGSAGIGLETARLARTEGANVIVTGRNPDRLEAAATELGALRSAAFDATDLDALDQFFDELPTPIDHVMVTAGRPYYALLADIDLDRRAAPSTSICGCPSPWPGTPSARCGPAARCCSSAAPAPADRHPAWRSSAWAPPRCPP